VVGPTVWSVPPDGADVEPEAVGSARIIVGTTRHWGQWALGTCPLSN
jgi:hypothetical protein